jgi:hypothetical protein
MASLRGRRSCRPNSSIPKEGHPRRDALTGVHRTRRSANHSQLGPVVFAEICCIFINIVDLTEELCYRLFRCEMREGRSPPFIKVSERFEWRTIIPAINVDWPG